MGLVPGRGQPPGGDAEEVGPLVASGEDGTRLRQQRRGVPPACAPVPGPGRERFGEVAVDGEEVRELSRAAAKGLLGPRERRGGVDTVLGFPPSLVHPGDADVVEGVGEVVARRDTAFGESDRPTEALPRVPSLGGEPDSPLPLDVGGAKNFNTRRKVTTLARLSIAGRAGPPVSDKPLALSIIPRRRRGRARPASDEHTRQFPESAEAKKGEGVSGIDGDGFPAPGGGLGECLAGRPATDLGDVDEVARDRAEALEGEGIAAPRRRPRDRPSRRRRDRRAPPRRAPRSSSRVRVGAAPGRGEALPPSRRGRGSSVPGGASAWRGRQAGPRSAHRRGNGGGRLPGREPSRTCEPGPSRGT